MSKDSACCLCYLCNRFCSRFAFGYFASNIQTRTLAHADRRMTITHLKSFYMNAAADTQSHFEVETIWKTRMNELTFRILISEQENSHLIFVQLESPLTTDRAHSLTHRRTAQRAQSTEHTLDTIRHGARETRLKRKNQNRTHAAKVRTSFFSLLLPFFSNWRRRGKKKAKTASERDTAKWM